MGKSPAVIASINSLKLLFKREYLMKRLLNCFNFFQIFFQPVCKETNVKLISRPIYKYNYSYHK